MGSRWGDVSGHVEKRRGRWQVVLELGEQRFRQCPACRDERRADGRRRGSPRWWVADGRVPAQCPDCGASLVEDEGRRQQRHGGFARKVDAQEELSRVISEHRAGRDPTATELTLSEWFERWLDIIAASVQIGELSPKTAAGYESHVRNHLRPQVGHIDVRKLTPGDVADLLREIQAAGRAPATAARVRATLSRALSDAMRHELVHRNVAQIAKPPRTPKREPSAFTRDEFERILEVLDDHRLGPAFLFAAWTGLRASELRGLRWSDVDLEHGTFRIRRGLHRITKASKRVVPETGLVTSKPKTRDSGNELPLSKHAIALLEEHRETQRSEYEVLGVDGRPDGYVFTSVTGTPLEPSNLNHAWQKLLDQAEVDYRTDDGRGRGLHELRRTFATRLRDRGVPLEDVQRLGRWSSPQVLLQLYAATDEDRLRAAADEASDALGGS